MMWLAIPLLAATSLWEGFGDAKLSSLMERATANNLDVKVALDTRGGVAGGPVDQQVFAVAFVVYFVEHQ